jgi:hypothetical protein
MVYYLDGEVWLLLRGEEPVLLRLTVDLVKELLDEPQETTCQSSFP